MASFRWSHSSFDSAYRCTVFSTSKQAHHSLRNKRYIFTTSGDTVPPNSEWQQQQQSGNVNRINVICTWIRAMHDPSDPSDAHTHIHPYSHPHQIPILKSICTICFAPFYTFELNVLSVHFSFYLYTKVMNRISSLLFPFHFSHGIYGSEHQRQHHQRWRW